MHPKEPKPPTGTSKTPFSYNRNPGTRIPLAIGRKRTAYFGSAPSGRDHIAMTGSCLVSGVIGVMVPLTLERLGTDPATASTIFLTTATDVLSMGLLLALATLMI